MRLAAPGVKRVRDKSAPTIDAKAKAKGTGRRGEYNEKFPRQRNWRSEQSIAASARCWYMLDKADQPDYT